MQRAGLGCCWPWLIQLRVMKWQAAGRWLVPCGQRRPQVTPSGPRELDRAAAAADWEGGVGVAAVAAAAVAAE